MAVIHWKGNSDEYQYSLTSAPRMALEDLINTQMKAAGLKDMPQLVKYEMILCIQNGIHVRFNGADTALTATKFNGMLQVSLIQSLKHHQM